MNASVGPSLAVFPKAYMDPLCVDHSMTLDEWIALAATLDVPGLEFYSEFLDLADPTAWAIYRCKVEELGMQIPMLCCSPDFTHPSPKHRHEQLEKEKQWIEMAAELGATYCRVLSGQRRPEVSLVEGLQFAVDAIAQCCEYAQQFNITLNLENHYKDNYWEYPEFAQKTSVFCELVDALPADLFPNFGVNFDPSNTLLAGENPLDLLQRVKQRVVTMHASDRYLRYGTIEEFLSETASRGYSDRLSHGEIGKGLNNYDAIFSILSEIGFHGWISIEDGVDGFHQLESSVKFLKRKMSEYWLGFVA